MVLAASQQMPCMGSDEQSYFQAYPSGRGVLHGVVRCTKAMDAAKQLAGANCHGSAGRSLAQLGRRALQLWGNLATKATCDGDKTAGKQYDPIPLKERLCLEIGRCVCVWVTNHW